MATSEQGIAGAGEGARAAAVEDSALASPQRGWAKQTLLAQNTCVATPHGPMLVDKHYATAPDKVFATPLHGGPTKVVMVADAVLLPRDRAGDTYLRALQARFAIASSWSLERAADVERIQRAALRSAIERAEHGLCETMLVLASRARHTHRIDFRSAVTPHGEARACSDGETRPDRDVFGAWLLIGTPDHEFVARRWAATFPFLTFEQTSPLAVTVSFELPPDDGLALDAAAAVAADPALAVMVRLAARDGWML